MITKALNSDIDSLVGIHRDSLPYSFLARLGEKFLRKKLYPFLLNSENVLVLVKEIKGKVVGFALFAHSGCLLTREIMKLKPCLGIAVMRESFSHPRIFLTALRRLKNPQIILSKNEGFTGTLEDQILTIDEMPELYALAVSYHFRNKGIGTKLTQKGLSMLQEKNRPKCIVKSTSCTAHKFFQKLGFRDVGREVRGTDERFLMIYEKNFK